jgi:hypothetical protein
MTGLFIRWGIDSRDTHAHSNGPVRTQREEATYDQDEQESNPHYMQNLLPIWFCFFSLHNCKKINVCCLSHHSVVFYDGVPSNQYITLCKVVLRSLCLVHNPFQPSFPHSLTSFNNKLLALESLPHCLHLESFIYDNRLGIILWGRCLKFDRLSMPISDPVFPNQGTKWQSSPGDDVFCLVIIAIISIQCCKCSSRYLF